MKDTKTVTDVMARIVELVGEDAELHAAVIRLLNAQAAHELALANAANARRRKLEAEKKPT